MTPHDAALLAGAGFLAGVCNAVAGGGSLITFPTLLATGLPPVTANVTNAVGVWPGYVGGVFAFRERLTGHGRTLLAPMIAALIGAICGAVLLLLLPSSIFKAIVPYLILGATGVFAAQPLITRTLNRLTAPKAAVPVPVPVGGPVNGPGDGPGDAPGDGTGDGRSEVPADEGAGEPALERHFIAQLIGIFLAGLYGAYFAGGLGIIILAVLMLTMTADILLLQGMKSVLQLGVSSVATLAFGVFGPVHWLSVLVLAPACLLGGNLGGRLSKLLKPTALRVVVTVFGVVIGVRMRL
ncbi:sulfite exporter TauE/SafE family protein [Actinomadura barringtoniae]|uniref:Probable membrane transporter protein n=1 Tax=Actinomadura barringtoniae TaxID=1427535 RepID=A0A939PD94_9ACTN|nr:sulfite exporter TauE/SafE family protein [Actinomadura barringtoniae]MBO2450223.1 sulfite exporter TauE/SafE family protein [Actinomadura barringtoniae]